MPLRGENVGTAYVKILADGSDLDRSIRSELDDIDKEFDEKGREHAKSYDEAMEKELRKGAPKNADAIDKMFEKHGAKARALADEINNELFQRLDEDIRQGHGEVLGERMMRDIRKGFVSDGGWASFGKDFEHLFDQLPALTEKANREIRAENIALEKERVSRFNTSVAEITAGYERIIRGSKSSTTGQRDNIGDTITSLRKLRTELEHVPSLGGEDRDRTSRLLRDMERGLDRVHPGLRRLSNDLDSGAVRMGRLFGKGSRNDFLNFTGGAVEGMNHMIARVPRLVEGLLNIPQRFGEMTDTASTFFKTFTEGIKVGAGPIESLKVAFSGVEGAGSGLFTTLLSGAVAIPVLVVAIGTLIAAASLLLGVIVALASSLAFALVGALGAVVGALLPVAAGIGVLVAGIASMSDAQKKALSTAIKPFISGMKDIGKSVADSIFGLDTPFQNTIDNMTHALTSSNIKTLATDIGRTIGGIGNSWSIALNSKGFQDWIKAMDKTLPGQMVSLGDVTKNVVTGMGNIFLALQPIVTDFTTWLDKVTTSFAKWTGSKEGQKSMLDFFSRAEDSIKSVGYFLREVGGLLSDLLFNPTGKKAGDDMFTSMGDAVKRFRDYIADGKLENWFKQAKKFGDDLGDTIAGIGKVLDALDSPTFRKFAAFLLFTFSELADQIDTLLKPLIEFTDALVDLSHGDFSGFGKNIVKAFTDLGPAILQALTFGLGDNVLDIFTGLAGQIVDLWNSINWSGLGTTIVNSLTTGLSAIGTIIAGVMTSIGQGLADGASMVGSAAASLGTSIADGVGQGYDWTKTKTTDFVNWVGSGISNLSSTVRDRVSSMATSFTGKLSSAWDSTKSKATSFANNVKGGLSSALDFGRSKASSLASTFSGTLAGAFHTAQSVAGSVKNAIHDIGDGIAYTIDKVKSLISWLSKIHVPSLGDIGKALIPGIKTGGVVDPFGLHKVKKMAYGGLANFAQNYQIGEAGREAIVPLDRPLGQVDPAVRLLSAFAQGKLGNTSNSNDKTVDASGWVIQTPTEDPMAVAQEVLDALTAKIV